MPRNYTFNPANRSYYDGDAIVPRSQIRRWVADANETLRGKLKAIGDDFLAGRINDAQAELDALELITKHHSAISVIANGGREQMDARAWGRAGNVVKSERQYMEALWRDYGNGEVTDDRLLSRVQDYADAGWRSYERLFTEYAGDAGFTRCVNTPGPSENPCEECQELTDAGEMDIGEMPAPGQRICGPGCQCSVDIVGIDATG